LWGTAAVLTTPAWRMACRESAWPGEVAPQTVVRAGYGVYFGSLGVTSFSPVCKRASHRPRLFRRRRTTAQTYIATLNNPFSTELIAPSGASSGPRYGSRAVTIVFSTRTRSRPIRSDGRSECSAPCRYSSCWTSVTSGTESAHLAVSQAVNNTPASYLSTSPSPGPDGDQLFDG